MGVVGGVDATWGAETKAMRGSFASLRMTAKNLQRQMQRRRRLQPHRGVGGLGVALMRIYRTYHFSGVAGVIVPTFVCGYVVCNVYDDGFLEWLGA